MLAAYRASGADLPFGHPRRAHGTRWRATTGASPTRRAGRCSSPCAASAATARAAAGGRWPSPITRRGRSPPRRPTRRGPTPRASAPRPAPCCAATRGACTSTSAPRRAWTPSCTTSPPGRTAPGAASELGHVVPGLSQYWLPWCLGARVTGRARIGGREVPLDGAVAYAEKNWGHGFPPDWWWGQAHGFGDGAGGLRRLRRRRAAPRPRAPAGDRAGRPPRLPRAAPRRAARQRRPRGRRPRHAGGCGAAASSSSARPSTRRAACCRCRCRPSAARSPGRVSTSRGPSSSRSAAAGAWSTAASPAWRGWSAGGAYPRWRHGRRRPQLQPEIDDIVARALAEDVGAGDVTTRRDRPRGRARRGDDHPEGARRRSSAWHCAEAAFRALDPEVHVRAPGRRGRLARGRPGARDRGLAARAADRRAHRAEPPAAPQRRRDADGPLRRRRSRAPARRSSTRARRPRGCGCWRSRRSSPAAAPTTASASTTPS